MDEAVVVSRGMVDVFAQNLRKDFQSIFVVGVFVAEHLKAGNVDFYVISLETMKILLLF